MGVVLFKMLTGRLPFGNFTAVPDILLAHAEQAPPPFSEVNSQVRVQPQIEAVVRRCLAKNPQERPAGGTRLAGRSARPRPGVHGMGIRGRGAAAGFAQRETQIDIDLGGVLDQMEAWMPEAPPS